MNQYLQTLTMKQMINYLTDNILSYNDLNFIKNELGSYFNPRVKQLVDKKIDYIESLPIMRGTVIAKDFNI